VKKASSSRRTVLEVLAGGRVCSSLRPPPPPCQRQQGGGRGGARQGPAWTVRHSSVLTLMCIRGVAASDDGSSQHQCGGCREATAQATESAKLVILPRRHRALAQARACAGRA
jgi:hypothetical protein